MRSVGVTALERQAGILSSACRRRLNVTARGETRYGGVDNAASRRDATRCFLAGGEQRTGGPAFAPGVRGYGGSPLRSDKPPVAPGETGYAGTPEVLRG